MRRLLIAVALLGMGLAVLLPQKAALAGASGRRNTMLALGAAALWQLGEGESSNAAILGAGTAIAYQRWQNVRDRERYGYYRDYRPYRRYRDRSRVYYYRDDGCYYGRRSYRGELPGWRGGPLSRGYYYRYRDHDWR